MSCHANQLAHDCFVIAFSCIVYSFARSTAFQMSSLADLPEVIGFFSYSREDDESYRGRLSALREAIQHELSAQLGRSKSTFRLWQDKDAIAPGKLWESEIQTAVEQSVFFIPIVTPRAINSDYCKFEFEAFLARERALGRTDLVFPILYVPVPALQNEVQWRNHPVLSTIAKRQYVDWQTFRYSEVHTPAMREDMARFCNKVVEALHQSWLSPEERKRQEEAVTAERAAAKLADTVSAVDKFLAAYPESHLAGEAKAMRGTLIDSDEADKGANEPVHLDLTRPPDAPRHDGSVVIQPPGQPAGATRAKPWPIMIGAVAIGIAGLAIVVATSQRETPTSPPTVAAPVDPGVAPVETKAAPVDTGQAVTFVDRGQAEFDKQDYDRAISDYSEAIRLDATYVAAFGNRGNAYYAKQDYDHAIADYNEVTRLDPNDERAFGNRGDAYYHKQDYDHAIVDYNEAIRLDPKDADVLGMRGDAYYHKQDYDHAIADYNKAIRLDPTNAGNFGNRGNAYKAKQDYDHAIADYSEVIRLDPTRASAFYARGLAKQRKGDSAGSKADIAAAKKLDPNVDK